MTYTERKLISFQLTDDWRAWYKGDDGQLVSWKVDAIGLVRVTLEHGRGVREWSHNELTGVFFGNEHGTQICSEDDNFVMMLRAGESPNLEDEENDDDDA